MHDRQGEVVAMLPVFLDFAPGDTSFRHETGHIQQLALSPPSFRQESEWPTWLPRELDELTPAQRERTRAWIRAAFLQQADDLQEFFLASIPRLSSFQAVEEMHASGLSLVGDSEINIYVVADLNDHVGSSIFVDIAHLLSHICQQLGLRPLTTGLLYLPSATSPAPVEEAIAYAALKELEYYFYHHAYDSEIASDGVLTDRFTPFNNGCYLLDSLNELGYTLQDTSQQISAVSEWLYAMTFLGTGTAIRKHRNRRYLSATLRGKARAYESFGIAVHYVPRQMLVDWATARLSSQVLRGILNTEPEADPEERLGSLVQALGLEADVLESTLRQQSNPQDMQETLVPLRQARVHQMESRARQVLQTIREQQLPILQDNLAQTRAQIQPRIQEILAKGIEITLEDMPTGGIALAFCILDRFHDRVSAFHRQVQERTANHRLELRRSLATVSETYYTMRSVKMSMPPWPISIWGIVALVILPLFYILQLIYQVIHPLHQVWGRITLGVLGLGVLGVLGFVIYRSIRQRRRVYDQHVRMIQERVDLESRPLIYRTMNAIYDDTRDAVVQIKGELEALIEPLHAAVTRFEDKENRIAYRLKGLATPGPFRSAIDLGRAERFFEHAVPDLETLIVALTQRLGPVSGWQAHATEAAPSFSPWLSDQLSLWASQMFDRHLDNMSVMDVLTQGMSEQEVSQVLQHMFESAHPLWNYEPRALRTAKTQRLTLLSLDTSGSAWANLVAPLVKIHPNVIPADTGDPFTMAFVHIHRGLPLFALRRIGEYRAHYAEMLWHSKLPIHTTSTLALVDDLLPFRRRPKLTTATLFAMGLALGSISLNAEGRYLAPRPNGRGIRLSSRKERSVALMGMDEAACREVRRQLEARISKEGKDAVRVALDEYLTVVPGLEDWEVKGILDFTEAYKLGNENPERVGEDVNIVQAE
jgi:hypothetical protein